MVKRIILALVVGVVTTLVIMLVGVILVSIDISWTKTIGQFFQNWAALLGLLAAVWYYFTLGTPVSRV